VDNEDLGLKYTISAEDMRILTLAKQQAQHHADMSVIGFGG
jgi:hypothetical protein